jgi:hypothetical protein
MSTINWSAVFVIAALAAVYGFGRDILKSVLDKRKKLIKGEQDTIMAPLVTHGIVLKDTEMAIAAHSALLLQGRVDLTAERERRIQAESERDKLKERLDKAEERQTELLIQLGRFYGQSGAPGSGRGAQ